MTNVVSLTGEKISPDDVQRRIIEILKLNRRIHD